MTKKKTLEIVVLLISTVAGSITILQNIGFLSIAEQSAFKSPTTPFVAVLGGLLLIVTYMLWRKK